MRRVELVDARAEDLAVDESAGRGFADVEVVEIEVGGVDRSRPAILTKAYSRLPVQAGAVIVADTFCHPTGQYQRVGADDLIVRAELDVPLV